MEDRSASGPSSPRPPTPGPYGALSGRFTGQGPRVVILGDSLTVLGWNDLYALLDGNYAVEIAALVGEGYAAGAFRNAAEQSAIMRAAARYARSRPAVAVIALGTNDAWKGWPVDRSLSAMATMVDELRPARLVGVTLPVESAASGWDGTTAKVLNDAMREWADQVVDWDALSREPGMLVGDGVHTTPAGTKVRAAAIAAAVEGCGSRRRG